MSNSRSPAFPAACLAAALAVLLAAPEAWADLFGGDIPLLGTLVTQGSQQLANATQLIRTANEQLTAAKRVVGYAEEAKAVFAHFQNYSASDFGDDVLGLTGGAVPVSDASRLVSGVTTWAPATGELRTLVRRCLSSEGTGSASCRQMHEAITQADAREALSKTFGPALHSDTRAADYEVARALSAADTHGQQEAARAALSAASRRMACAKGGDSTVCGLSQTARQESQLDTVNAQLSEANRLHAMRLALQNAERKQALAEAQRRRELLAEGLKAVDTPPLEVQADGVRLVGAN
jgi:hypothetical protein